MSDATGEGHCPAVFAVLEPVRDDVADQLVAIHAIGELTLDVVARDGAHALQVWIDRGVDARPDQMTLLDQRRDLWAFDHHREDAAEATAIAATWCCGRAE